MSASSIRRAVPVRRWRQSVSFDGEGRRVAIDRISAEPEMERADRCDRQVAPEHHRDPFGRSAPRDHQLAAADHEASDHVGTGGYDQTRAIENRYDGGPMARYVALLRGINV